MGGEGGEGREQEGRWEGRIEEWNGVWQGRVG